MAILKAQKGTKTDLSTGLSDKEMIRQRNRRHFDSIMTPEVQEQLAGAAMGSAGVLSKVGAAPDAMAKGVGYLINKAKPVFSKAKGLLRNATNAIKPADKIVIKAGRDVVVPELGHVKNLDVYRNGKQILNQDAQNALTIVDKGDDTVVGNIFLPEELRGKGLTKKIYQAVADHTGKPLVSSAKYGLNQSEAGARVWKNRDSFLPKQVTPIVDKAKLAAGVPTIPNKTLYRVDNPNVQFKASQTANGDIQAKYAGQWFIDDPKELASYASKYAKLSKDTPGMRFSSVEVPMKDLPKYNVKNIPEMQGMDVEPNNWAIPEALPRIHRPVADPSRFVNQFNNAKIIDRIFGGL